MFLEKLVRLLMTGPESEKLNAVLLVLEDLFLKLSHVLNNLSSDLSGGQKKLLEIGRALMGRPKLILLDEPVAGVNPTLGVEIAERIAELREAGLTFLIVEHDMDMVARLCDPVIVMANGTNLTEGSFDDIVGDARVQDAYLGRRA